MLQVSIKGHDQDFEREVEAVVMVTISSDEEREAWKISQLILGMMSAEKSIAMIESLENLIRQLKKDVVKHSLESILKGLGKSGEDEHDGEPCDCEACSIKVD